ncbi:class II glutamine amidotransferase [Engelhardtia mirabilis]|uniref:Transglutaminase-like superfamily protein n=1 Tax=Engelhardtia mirabilis TaxID=2528011 RepID=A0A518BGM4_9BACT|nr:Transglutaminase-like superfamily protein [Planctomycetes bacterium Pla133]QDV00464.1 Transglutaminase-like superfamily protein [Planctomycetes bacterium Pla86]
MTRLLAMSFDAPATPRITLRWQSKQTGGSSAKFGWGVAWYPPDELEVVTIKDPTSHGDDAMTAMLREWPRFRSTIFLGNLRGAARRVSQEDTHPFDRRFAGRSWVLTHNGWLNGDYAANLPLGLDQVHGPVGHTDSEHILCWLLDRLREAGARRLADAGWERIRGWFTQVNQLGTANIVISDGLDLLVYQDKDLYNPMHWIRRKPPHATSVLENDDIELDLSDARDENRTGIIVATAALSDDEWTGLQPGQMLVLRRGGIEWDSSGTEATPPGLDLPTPAPSPALVASSAPATAQGPEHGAQAHQQSATGNLPPKPLPATNLVQVQNMGGVAPVVHSAGGTVVGSHSESRLYRVHHETSYSYEKPIERSTHVLRLRPVVDRFQELLEYDLAIEPQTSLHRYEDVFGNEVASFDLERPYSALKLVSTSLVRVRVDPRRTIHSPVRRSTIPLVWMPWQRQMMTPYLLSHELPETQLRELFEYAMGFVERQDYDLAESLLDMNRTINKDYAYVQGSTTVETTPFEVYTTRRGVCQDFANLLICLARLIGVPARYRVGYIDTSKDYENTLQSDASHAWAEVYLPWFGWQGFDPTNGCLAELDHVRVACGRNYRDATPTSGTIYRGGGTEQLMTEVRVERQAD